MWIALLVIHANRNAPLAGWYAHVDKTMIFMGLMSVYTGLIISLRICITILSAARRYELSSRNMVARVESLRGHLESKSASDDLKQEAV